MKRVLLTGATGFLGSHLLFALIERGYKVTVLKRSTSNTWRIQQILKSVTVFDLDLAPLEEVFKVQKFDVIIHTACNYGRQGEQASAVVDANLVFGLRLLDAAVSYQTDLFINTDTLLPKNINHYSLSKKQFVEWLLQRSSQIQVINLRLEYLYGPKDDVTKFVPWFLHQLKMGSKRIPLTEGSQLRDFIYIDDVVAAYLLVLDEVDKEGFCEFDVGTGQLTSVKTFVSELYRIFKIRNPDVSTVLGFGDVPVRSGELKQPELDNQSLKRLGWRPAYSIEAGIEKNLDNQ